MKYLIRSIKYFFYFIFLMTVIILALLFIGAVEGGISDIFEDGYNSLWKIALFFALISAIYPKFAFISRKLEVCGDCRRVRDEVVSYFKERGIDLESESEDKLTFRRRALAGRIARLCEDRITLIWTDEEYIIEGMRKDIVLFSTALEYRICPDRE